MKTTLFTLILAATLITACTTIGTDSNTPNCDSLVKDSIAVDTAIGVGAIKSVAVDTLKVDSLKK